MNIVIATDAWEPQVNGVVTTLREMRDFLVSHGHDVLMVTPYDFFTVPCPSYTSIKLAIFPYRKLSKKIDNFKPDAVHISTEGPIGLSVRRYCKSKNLKFTTAYHTQFPEYIRFRLPIPLSLSYRYIRWFHSLAEKTMVPTEHQCALLHKWGIRNLVIWTRGVDVQLFHPERWQAIKTERPIYLYAGRVSVEKNLEAFLSLDLAGTKYVVGDGPDLDYLRKRYPDTIFTGFKFSHELAEYIASADVFVFPSKTDTFGIVILDALSSGVPVAAYPVTGPIDIINNGVTGYLHENLEKAIDGALDIDGQKCREYALTCSWHRSGEQFLSYLYDNSSDKKGERTVLSRLETLQE